MLWEEIEAALPDYSAQLVPEKSKDELLREEAMANVPTKSVDLTSTNKEFDPESAELIKGRPIREKPESICDAVGKLGEKVVVVGDMLLLKLKELETKKQSIAYLHNRLQRFT